MMGSVSVIYNAFAISAMERKKQFGLLASIGATQKQIRKSVWQEGLTVEMCIRDSNMSEQCTHNGDSCPSAGNCQSGSANSKEQFRAYLNPESSVKKVIGVVSGKGGVGKSMVTSLMAIAANKAGLRTRCV